MKKYTNFFLQLLLIKFFSILNAYSQSDDNIYFVCLNKMVKDRSTVDNFKPGEEFGFQFFKIDLNKSEITVHEQIFDNKPTKIGSAILDFQNKKVVEFEIRREEGDTIMSDKFKLFSKGYFFKGGSYLEEYKNYSFEATTYVKVNNDIIDSDFKAENCIPPKTDNPKKAKKIYKKWIKKGY